MQQSQIDLLQETFAGVTPRASADCLAFNCPIEDLVAVAEFLLGQGFDMLVDATAIDEGVEATPRFTVVYHWYSTVNHEYIRVAASCADSENPVAPTLSGVFPAADWHERETYDLMGIVYEKHPDLRRILMWDGYPYHPLRKDFPLAGIEVPFPAADVQEATDARVQAAPMMGGPFTAGQGGPMSKKEPKAKDQSWTEETEKPI